jgi:predicted DNA-binding transcriptional regulator AlpA
MMETEAFLTTEDLSLRYKLALETILYWRKKGVGPAGVKIGRHVRYPLSGVLAWEQAQIAKAAGE